MAIGVYFSDQSMTAAMYANVIKELEAAGTGSPKCRLCHVTFGDTNDLAVFDVWESQADLDAFGQVLMPILEKNGAKPQPPQSMPVHNIIKP